jgi:amino acid adenylation domain-containing protein
LRGNALASQQQETDQGGGWVPELVLRHAAVAPGSLAVCSEKQQLSFAELDKQANRLARHLKALGIIAEKTVGLYFDRSTNFVMAALAVLKAGGAFVPLDASHPVARIDAILSDAGISVLLSHQGKAAKLARGPWKTVDLDSEASNLESYSAGPLGEEVEGSNLAYIVYTSGSTGQPKGVEVTHANLSHLVHWYLRASGVRPDDRASQMLGFGFDAAILEIWGPLCCGASLHLTDECSRRSPEELRDWLLAQRITVAVVPTLMAEHLIVYDWPEKTALRRLVIGGDTLHRYPKPGLPFVLENQYGPSECTVLVTSGVVSSGGADSQLPSIGSPIDDTEILILDEEQRPVPAGEEGEICVAGPQVARGYRNLPELTAKKFVREPGSGKRLYRTGDRGRRLPSGEIAFSGRLDDQIKIRGNRIEPDEIVANMMTHRGIRNAVVVARADDGGEKMLVAYLVPADGVELGAAEIREHLRGRLPDYMIPASYIGLRSLPVTTSGKYDKRSLPTPSAANLLPESPQTTPAVSVAGSATETRVAEFVNKLLGGRTIDRDDDLFLAGGHSMLAAQLLAQVRVSLGVNLSLRQLFQAPTIASLAAEVDRKLATK